MAALCLPRISFVLKMLTLPRSADRVRRCDPSFVSLLLTIRVSIRDQAALQLEILAFRPQLHVLNRSRPQRLRLTQADRMLWIWLSKFWNRWRAAVVIVKPETVLAWHRRGFRLFWTWKSQCRKGRPSIPRNVRQLIRTMAEANPLWGAPRIHGELLKLSIDVSQLRCRRVGH